MPVLSDLPSAEQAKILELYTRNIIQPRELVRINNSIKIPYYLNDSEIIQLEKIFNRYVVLDNGFIKKNNKTFPRKLLRSSHPIAASLNYFANNEAYNEASTYQRFIDIGSDIRRGKDAHHCCNLVDTARDANRYLSQSNSLHSELGNNIEDNLVNGSSNKINMCFKGAQNCKVKAKCAISVNSLYDVEISSIPKIFINHNIDILIAYMFLPLELLDYGYPVTCYLSSALHRRHKHHVILIKNSDVYDSDFNHLNIFYTKEIIDPWQGAYTFPYSQEHDVPFTMNEFNRSFPFRNRYRRINFDALIQILIDDYLHEKKIFEDVVNK